jgi:hypothetical protein
VLDEAGQGEAGRRHRGGGGLLIVQALALDSQRGAVKVEQLSSVARSSVFRGGMERWTGLVGREFTGRG